MINTVLSIRRSSGLWGGVSPETVKRYREELEALKKQLNDFSFLYEHTLFGGELIKALANEIDEEVNYCLFYDEFCQRQNEPNFGQWVFRKQEDINLDTPNFWQKVAGDQWTRTNGRVKAIIQFDRTGLMVKITLEYRNDSTHLKFVEESRYSIYKYPTAHLKREASIEAKLQEFKNEADAFLNKHLYPLYSQHEADLLKELLHL